MAKNSWRSAVGTGFAGVAEAGFAEAGLAAIETAATNMDKNNFFIIKLLNWRGQGVLRM
jgi:hypothetical protein